MISTFLVYGIFTKWQKTSQSTLKGRNFEILLHWRRANLVQVRCNRFNLRNNSILSVPRKHLLQILVDRDSKFLYCYVPKAACTEWKRIWLDVFQNVDTKDWNHEKVHKEMRKYEIFPNLSDQEKVKILEEYTKFIVVRDPFERLLSAFREKLEANNYNISRFSKLKRNIKVQGHKFRKIIKKLTKDDPGLEQDIEFYEFLQYVLTPSISKKPSYNIHWRPIFDLCHPCLINYNAIAKYETLERDSNFILDLLEADRKFPRSKSSTTKILMRRYYKTIPPEAIRELYEIYKYDFLLFDYKANE